MPNRGGGCRNTCQIRNYRYAWYSIANSRARSITAKMSSQNQNSGYPFAGLIIINYCSFRVGRKKTTQLIIMYKQNITEYRQTLYHCVVSPYAYQFVIGNYSTPGASDNLRSGRRTAKLRTHHFTPPLVRAGNETPQDCSRQKMPRGGVHIPIYRYMYNIHIYIQVNMHCLILTTALLFQLIRR